MKMISLPVIRYTIFALAAVGIMLSSFLVTTPHAHAETPAYDSLLMTDLIKKLLEQIAALQVQLAVMQGTNPIDSGKVGECAQFTRAMYLGSNDATTAGEVTKLQSFLTKTGDYSYGSITGYFGPATQVAVQRWQSKNGIVSYGDPDTTGYGLVGNNTRLAMNKACKVKSEQPVAIKKLPKPVVETGGYSFANTKDSQVRLSGFVDPRGNNDTVVWFEWAESKDLLKDSGSTAQRNYSPKVVVSTAQNPELLATMKGGFIEDKKYYYRMGAENSDSRIYGEVRNFLVDFIQDNEDSINLEITPLQNSDFIGDFVSNVQATAYSASGLDSCDFTGSYAGGNVSKSLDVSGEYAGYNFATVGSLSLLGLQSIKANCTLENGVKLIGAKKIEFNNFSEETGLFNVYVNGSLYIDSLTPEIEAYAQCLEIQDDYNIHENGVLECYWDGDMLYQKSNWKG